MTATAPHTVRIATEAGAFIAADHWPGHRTPVILAHGGGQTRHSWGGTAATLAARGHRVVSIDLRGHGDSTWAPDGDYSMPALRDDAMRVAAWIRHDDPDARLAWVGASLGGVTGLFAVDTAPAWFASLTLVDITPRPATSGVDRVVEFMAAHADVGFADLHEAADTIAAYQPGRPRPKDVSGLEKNLRQGDDGRWRWHWDPAMLGPKSSIPPDDPSDPRHGELEQIARRLTLPTLLVRGRLSDMVTQTEVDEFLAMAPHAQFVDVHDAAHMVAGDKNDVFTDAVVSFLDG